MDERKLQEVMLAILQYGAEAQQLRDKMIQELKNIGLNPEQISIIEEYVP